MNDNIKRIWGYWINDKDQTSSGNPDFLYVDRLEKLHKNWKITIINKIHEKDGRVTEDSLYYYLKDDEDGKFIKKLLSNKIISSAHKSDVVRFYLLKTYGGFWIDLSTFFIKSLDEEYDIYCKEKIDFACYYAPTENVISWIYRPFVHLYDSVSANKMREHIYNKKYLQLKKPDFDFIPENYYLFSKKDCKITSNVYFHLRSFWEGILDKIRDRNHMCFYLNAYMSHLCFLIFDINGLVDLDNLRNMLNFGNKNPIYDENGNFNPDSRLIPYVDEKGNEDKDASNMGNYLSLMFDCSYLFNYLQIYIAIIDFYKNSKYNIIEYQSSSSVTIENNLKKLPNYSDLCFAKNCKDFVIENDQLKVFLSSGTSTRLPKWSDNFMERITWKNTKIYKILEESFNGSGTNAEKKTKFEKIMSELGISRIKFGSWSRDNNEGLRILKTYYGPIENSRGGYKEKYIKYKLKYINLQKKYNAKNTLN